ncbi:MFS general substrate transporter [Dacryopinax primogenitus]|uniref:MFS general substrate transporter n=1 Tax=Dacryopinax primogenitus (strain DJM 731) TaxID=1858805 RepID=M5FNE1_DACPD|nr:MFS general substrate transporter [Dacryopinax primogenitus]EJT97285.1 MFS general substrate transporter [Dacryopinax primogenitus]
MLLASFCTQIWQLFITQGVMPALGWGMLLPFVFTYPSQWFKRLRAMATGLVIAGGSLGGAIASLIIRAMLTKLGFRNTLLIYSFVHGCVMLLGCCLLKSRPIPGAPTQPARIVWLDWDILRNPMFWSAAGAMCCTCFGYPSPLYFMSTYAASKLPHLSPTSLSIPLAINNFFSALGRTLVGRLADRIGVINAFVISVTLSGLSQLLIWRWVESYAGIMGFAIVFGFFGGCFISLATPLAASLFGVHNLATLSGMLLVFNLPGNTAGAPIFGAILRAGAGGTSTGDGGAGGAGAGENWNGAIVFSGMIQLVGVLCICYARIRKAPRVFAIA